MHKFFYREKVKERPVQKEANMRQKRISRHPVTWQVVTIIIGLAAFVSFTVVALALRHATLDVDAPGKGRLKLTAGSTAPTSVLIE